MKQQQQQQQQEQQPGICDYKKKHAKVVVIQMFGQTFEQQTVDKTKEKKVSDIAEKKRKKPRQWLLKC